MAWNPLSAPHWAACSSVLPGRAAVKKPSFINAPCGARLISLYFNPLSFFRAALDGIAKLHLVMTIGEGREVGCFRSIASQNVIIYFLIKLFERIGETIVVPAGIRGGLTRFGREQRRVFQQGLVGCCPVAD